MVFLNIYTNRWLCKFAYVLSHYYIYERVQITKLFYENRKLRDTFSVNINTIEQNNKLLVCFILGFKNAQFKRVNSFLASVTDSINVRVVLYVNNHTIPFPVLLNSHVHYF